MSVGEPDYDWPQRSQKKVLGMRGPHRPLRCLNVAWSMNLLRCVQVGWCWDIMFWRPQETRLGPICWRSTGTTRICSPAYKYASHAHKWRRKILLKEISKLKVAPNNHLHNTLDCSHLLSGTPPHSPYKNKKCLEIFINPQTLPFRPEYSKLRMCSPAQDYCVDPREAR